LLLAAIGLYGVIAYAIQRRTHEIGIRMLLGARPSTVLWMVLRGALGMAISGIAIGPILSSWLFKIVIIQKNQCGELPNSLAPVCGRSLLSRNKQPLRGLLDSCSVVLSHA